MSADPEAIELIERPDGVDLSVKVVPGASRTRIVGALGNALKVAVAAAPEAGKANTQVVQLLAERFGLRRRDVRIVAGRSRPLKRVRLLGLTARRARVCLSKL